MSSSGSIIGAPRFLGNLLAVHSGIEMSGSWSWESAGLFVVPLTAAPGVFLRVSNNNTVLNISHADAIATVAFGCQQGHVRAFDGVVEAASWCVSC